MSKIKVELDVKVIKTKDELIEFRLNNNLREDWHEPDNQSITATVVGRYFDNADVDGSYDYALLLFKEGIPIAVVNLALLCAWATGYKD